MVALVLISLFFALPVSKIIWQVTPLPRLVQFPWRFLSLTTFALAVLAGRLPQKLAILVTIIIVISAVPFLKVERTFHPESYYTTNDDSTTVKNEYRSKWLSVNITNRPAEKIVQLSPTRLRVYEAYFPGLKVYVDGKETVVDYQTNGLVELSVFPGPHTVITRFSETPIHLFADAISLLGLFLVVISLIF